MAKSNFWQNLMGNVIQGTLGGMSQSGDTGMAGPTGLGSILSSLLGGANQSVSGGRIAQAQPVTPSFFGMPLPKQTSTAPKSMLSSLFGQNIPQLGTGSRLLGQPQLPTSPQGPINPYTLQQAVTNAMGMTGQSSSVGGGTTQTPASTTRLPWQQNPWAQLALGGGMMGLSKAWPTPKVPPLPQSIEDLRARMLAGQGGSPLGQEAQAQLMTRMKQGPQQIPQEMEEIERSEQNQLRDLYKNIRPGADVENDSAYKRDYMELQSRQGRRRVEWHREEQMKNIQTALGADQNTMSQLMAIAQADIGVIMTQLGLDAEEAKKFKDMFLGLGGQFMASAFTPQDELERKLKLQMYEKMLGQTI